MGTTVPFLAANDEGRRGLMLGPVPLRAAVIERAARMPARDKLLAAVPLGFVEV
jgi:hypothetical protein